MHMGRIEQCCAGAVLDFASVPDCWIMKMGHPDLWQCNVNVKCNEFTRHVLLGLEPVRTTRKTIPGGIPLGNSPQCDASADAGLLHMFSRSADRTSHIPHRCGVAS